MTGEAFVLRGARKRLGTVRLLRSPHSPDRFNERRVPLRFPKLYDLRADPFEMAGHGGAWERWRVEHAFVLVPVQAYVGQHLATYRERGVLRRLSTTPAAPMRAHQASRSAQLVRVV